MIGLYKMVAVLSTIVAVVVVLCTVLLFKLEKKRRRLEKLGGPKSIPLLGNVHQMKMSPKELTKQLYDWFDEYGSSLGNFRIMLSYHPLILICNPEDAEMLLNSNTHLEKSDDYKLMQPWLSNGLLLSSGEKWKTRRKLLTPTFHFKILHDFVHVFNKQSKVLLGKLRQHADGKPYNIFQDVTLCALDIICETAMGQCVNAQSYQASEYVQSVYRISEIIFKRVRSPWYWPKFLFDALGSGKEHDHCLEVMHSFTEKVIQERSKEFKKLYGTNKAMEEFLNDQDDTGVAGKKNRLAFLDMLLCASTEGSGSEHKLSFHDIREEVDTFMFEGHETTAASMNWAIHLIGAHPEVQEKVHEELDSIFGNSDRDVTMEDLKSMNYLECCIKESLRIFPVVMVFGRKLAENTVIGNLPIEKGSTVLVCPMAMNRNKKYYPNPEVFDPDRFSKENSIGRHPFCYVPFSAGSRNCIGQKFAMLEEKVVLSSIFRHYSVKSLQTRQELNPVIQLVLRPENGMIIELTPRMLPGFYVPPTTKIIWRHGLGLKIHPKDWWSRSQCTPM